MYNSADIHDVIQKYLKGEMPEDERAHFDEQLVVDQQLQNKVAIARAATVALREQKLAHIHELLQEEKGVIQRKRRIKTSVAIGLVITVLIGAYIYYWNKGPKPSLQDLKRDTSLTHQAVGLPSDTHKVLIADTHIAPRVQAQKKVVATPLAPQPIEILRRDTDVPENQKEQEKPYHIDPLKDQNVPKEQSKQDAKPVVNCEGVTITASWQTTKACDGDGTISVQKIVGGTEPYLFQLNGGMPQNQASFRDLPIGEYTLRIADQNNCKAEYSHIMIEKAFCDVHYDLNTSSGNVWLAPESTAPSKLSIYDKSGVLVYEQNALGDQKLQWDGKDLNHNLKFGYFEFVIQNAHNEILKGTITVTE